MISASCAPKACQADSPQAHIIFASHAPPGLHRTSKSPLGCAPQACQAGDPQKHTQSPPGHAPHACQASDPQAPTISTGSVIHRPAQSPPEPCPSGLPGPQYTGLHNFHSARPTPLRHTRPSLQRPARLPQKQASACRPVGPHPPATHRRRAPNLPRRHRQV
jgi:hypothetical protein